MYVWQRQLHIKYLDFEGAFHSIPRAYEIPQPIVFVIKSFYNNFKCRVGLNIIQ